MAKKCEYCGAETEIILLENDEILRYCPKCKHGTKSDGKEYHFDSSQLCAHCGKPIERCTTKINGKPTCDECVNEFGGYMAPNEERGFY